MMGTYGHTLVVPENDTAKQKSETPRLDLRGSSQSKHIAWYFCYKLFFTCARKMLEVFDAGFTGRTLAAATKYHAPL